MKLKFEISKKEKRVFSIIFAIILIISNGLVAYFSADKLDKFIPIYLKFIVGMWLLYAWAFSSIAIFTHYFNETETNEIL